MKNANGELCLYNKAITSVLNYFFTSVFSMENYVIPNITVSPNTNALRNTIITDSQINQLLSKINTCKTPGPDNIYPRFIK